MIVEAKNLSKKYGKNIALDDFSLDLKEGSILGILGPNGSGKSTFMKILAGLIRDYKGQVLIEGQPIGVSSKAKISYLPDRPFLPDNMTVEGSRDYFMDFFEDFNETKFQKLISFMGLSKDMKVKELSKGMNEKLHLSLILSRDARLFILDEPIAGVDPVARDQILEAIIDNILDKSSMIITTHLVRDMENIFDEVLFLSQGRERIKGNKEDLINQHGMTVDELYKDIFSREV